MTRNIWTFLTLVLFSIVLVGCQQTSSLTEEQLSDDKPIIRFASTGDAGILNPFRHQMKGAGTSRTQMVYDSLLEKGEEGLIPWLATSYEIKENHRVITFTLREDMTWHDGKPVTAEDVAFTFDYYRQHPPVMNLLVTDAGYAVEKTEVVDSHTVTIYFSSPQVNHLNAVGFSRIIPKHIWENVEDPYTFNGEGVTIGSGPFVVDTYEPAHGTYRLVAYERYPKEVEVQSLQWIPVSDEILAFREGTIDLINTTADMFQQLKEDERYATKELASYHVMRIMLNMENSPVLKDKKIRQALSAAIDRQAIIDKIERGSGELSGQGFVPIHSPWYNDNIPTDPYNLDKAKSLLDGQTLSFTLTIGNRPKEAKIAQLLQRQLQAVGVALTIQTVDTNVLNEKYQLGDYEMLLFNMGGVSGDPIYMNRLYAAKPNPEHTLIRGYDNPTLQSLLKRQAVESDVTKRMKWLHEAQAIIAEDVPVLLLHSAYDRFVYDPKHYDQWFVRYDHGKIDHNKLSYVAHEEI